MGTAELDALVGALSELYQPVYGHPEYDAVAARPSADRLALVAPIVQRLEQRLGRPVRVLDLGCAQGFFSLSLAASGATVTGVDMQPADIALCNALAATHPALDVTFVEGRVEDVIEELSDGTFDVVLAFNVLHHVAHAHGFSRTQELMRRVAGCVELVLAEIALRTEPLYWASAQPEHPGEFFADFAFVHQIGEAPTHLSPQARPLYFASSRWCDLGEQMLRIDAWMPTSHELAGNFHAGTRRYFECEGWLVKYFTFDAPPPLAEANRRELAREAAFLASPPAGVTGTPRLFADGADEHAGWLVRAWIPGRRLSSIIDSGADFDRRAVLSDVLDSLCALEAAGFYHADLRLWNVIVDADERATIIDYGEITDSPACNWPGDVFLSFLIFVHEISGTTLPRILPTRVPAFAPEHFAGVYRDLVAHVWRVPQDRWSFEIFRAIWRHLIDSPQAPDVGHSVVEPGERMPWQAAIEQYLDTLGEHQAALQELVAAAMARQRESEAWARQAADAALVERSRLMSELDDARTQRSTMDAAAAGLRHELERAREALAAQEAAARRETEVAEALRQAQWAALQSQRDAERDASTRQLADASSAMAAIGQRLEAQMQLLEAARAERDASAGQLSVAVSDMAGLRQQLASETRLLETARGERDAIARQLAAAVSDMAGVRQQLAGEARLLVAARAERDALEAEVGKERATTHHWWSVSVQWQEQFKAMEKSASWRLTAPLRFIAGGLRRLFRLPAASVAAGRRVARKAAVGVASGVLRRPRLRYRVGSIVRKHPALRERLRRFGRDAGLLSPLEAAPVMSPIDGMAHEDLAGLSARGREVLGDLRSLAGREQASR